jgi:heavy metal sensor kinase
VRARLALWHAGVLALVVCAFSAAVYLLVRVQLQRDLDGRLARDLATVLRTYRAASYDLVEAESRAGVELFEVVERGRVLYRSTGWARVGPAPERLGEAPAASWTAPDGAAYRVAVHAEPGLRVAVAVDERELRGALSVLALVLALGVPAAALLAVLGGAFLAGRVLAPVGVMAERARRITAESLDARLPVEDPEDELGRLAGVFNGTLARLEGSFERLRRFTADASHELRTPLTALRSVGEVALQEPLEPAAYREVIGSMLEEVERLTGLVEVLLVLARADSGRLPAARQPVDLGLLAAGVAEHLRVLAEEKGQALLVDAAAAPAACDPALVRQALVAVVDNAITYTPRGGEVRVSARPVASGGAALEVSDTGPGIAPEERERVFERFYRVDAGRSREGGGAGLGLALARAAVEATGGRIELEGAPGGGSLFRLVLPGA